MSYAEFPFISEFAGDGKTRVITSDSYGRRMATKMHSETGKETYKKRKETVEWPFCNIKQIRSKLEVNVPVIGTIRTSVANSASKVGSFLLVRTIVNPKCQC